MHLPREAQLFWSPDSMSDHSEGQKIDKVDETFTDLRAYFGLRWKSLMTYVSVASPCYRSWIYCQGFRLGWISLFLIVFSSGGFCLSVWDVHVRRVIDWRWWKVQILILAQRFHSPVLSMVFSAGPTTRTHLACCLTSSWVHVAAGLNSDAGMQIHYWMSGTNTCESVM